MNKSNLTTEQYFQVVDEICEEMIFIEKDVNYFQSLEPKNREENERNKRLIRILKQELTRKKEELQALEISDIEIEISKTLAMGRVNDQTRKAQ